ncbi:MAG: sigma-70 family RNA polymerase sigma factor [Acetatifactor sp.]|nr:sigma-70 family RNA polymerase sigma factor [Acetatifactor sp.]
MHLKKMCEEYYPLVFGYLMTLTGGERDLAEDLTQETFLRAIQRIKTFRGEAKMSTWLCQIAKYSFYQYLSKKSHFHDVSMDAAGELSAAELIEEAYLAREERSILYRSIEKLEPAMRDVILYRIVGELSFRQIGELLGKTENWARVTFYRGKEIVGKEMRKQDGQ